MKDIDYRPRFTFEISEELNNRCNKLLGIYGTKKAVFSPILEDLLDLVEEQGQMILGLIIDRAVKPRDILPILHIPKEGGETNE